VFGIQANIGQEEDMDAARSKALSLGAEKVSAIKGICDCLAVAGVNFDQLLKV
jgi:argininosuccinate synthase